jgi:hypothetical protein
LKFTLLPERLAIVRLEPDAEIPSWATGRFASITRAPDELSIVCDQAPVPRDARASRGWRCLALHGPFDLNATGVAAEFTTILARERVSVFVISTYDTDYVLVSDESVESAIAALERAGHTVVSS